MCANRTQPPSFPYTSAMTKVTRSGSFAVYQIGEVAERLGLSQRTIRHYDDLGIVKPSARTSGGFRLYTDADIDRFVLLRPFKALGIGLDVARSALRALETLEQGDDAEARRTVQQVLDLIAQRRQELERTLSESVETMSSLQQVLPESATISG